MECISTWLLSVTERARLHTHNHMACGVVSIRFASAIPANAMHCVRCVHNRCHPCFQPSSNLRHATCAIFSFFISIFVGCIAAHNLTFSMKWMVIVRTRRCYDARLLSHDSLIFRCKKNNRRKKKKTRKWVRVRGREMHDALKLRKHNAKQSGIFPILIGWWLWCARCVRHYHRPTQINRRRVASVEGITSIAWFFSPLFVASVVALLHLRANHHLWYMRRYSCL